MIAEEIVRQRSYEIWRREGCPEGRSLENWLRAEMELKSELCMRAMDPVHLRRMVVPRPVITRRPSQIVSTRIAMECPYSSAAKR